MPAQLGGRTRGVDQRVEGGGSLAWLGRMAFEAVDLHRRVAVAADAEVGRRGRHAVGLLAGMALDAGLQAVLGAPDAAMHGVVTLMLEVLHVVAPHVGRRLHALAALRCFDNRLEHAAGLGWLVGGMNNTAQQQTEQEHQGTKSRDTAEPALPDHWCRPLQGGGGATRSARSLGSGYNPKALHTAIAHVRGSSSA